MFLDELISEFDRGLRSMTGVSRMSRPLPVPQESDGDGTGRAPELSPAERAHCGGTDARESRRRGLRAGALSGAETRDASRLRLRAMFDRAAREEEDHLAWTSQTSRGARLASQPAEPALVCRRARHRPRGGAHGRPRRASASWRKPSARWSSISTAIWMSCRPPTTSRVRSSSRCAWTKRTRQGGDGRRAASNCRFPRAR